ncbi:hypothetical protein WICMUC_003253 [Wickerhamomyces mucosus]|uniref:Uncharacterized protein n=1 Tax=Wickerhamomyces mucosus TaxID=1378264 RepID=A0A9P8TCT3_9ASCO|nr:hypothetical protein WICMUC_003253 [Wickerhamomyces mucosus]
MFRLKPTNYNMIGINSNPLVTLFKRYSSHINAIHRNTPKNNPSIPFQFQNKFEVDQIIAKYPSQYKKAATIPLLTLGQFENNGFCSISVMNEVAKILEIPAMRVYEVASFYTMFKRDENEIKPICLSVCTNIACYLKGSNEIYSVIKNYLKENPKDKEIFHLEEVECSGACTNAPVIEINNIYYEDLTLNDFPKLLIDLKNGNSKPGPQNFGRISCESSGEKTCLFNKEPFDVSKVTRSDI